MFWYQAQLLSHDENKALSPNKLQEQVTAILQANPDLAEAVRAHLDFQLKTNLTKKCVFHFCSYCCLLEEFFFIISNLYDKRYWIVVTNFDGKIKQSVFSIAGLIDFNNCRLSDSLLRRAVFLWQLIYFANKN